MIDSIRVGDRGATVRDIQRRLERLSGPIPDTEAGVFGSATLEAVRRFQRDRGLAADGVVGPETWRALAEAGYHLGDRLLWRTRGMMRGDDVRELQRRLNQLGFDCGPEDGIFGPLAASAVEEFQRNVALAVDGAAGPATVAALRRLEREHQRGNGVARVREREWLRRLAHRGLAGSRIVVDPAHGEGDPGHITPDGTAESTITWQVASRLAARLAARGANILLSRGPRSNPTASQRARLANEQGADLVLSIALNGVDSPAASGSATYYFGTAQFVSEAGWRLAELVQRALVGGGWQPDCRTHPMTWAILRETRMPTIVVEPGFATSPADAARLVDPGQQDALAATLAGVVGQFVHDGLPQAVQGR